VASFVPYASIKECVPVFLFTYLILETAAEGFKVSAKVKTPYPSLFIVYDVGETSE